MGDDRTVAMRSSEAEPYEQLLALIESELQLVAASRFDELPRLAAARAALVARLPPAPPACARSALERCAALNGQVREELLRRRAATLAALEHIRRGRQAVRGYTPFRRRQPRISANA